MEKKINNIIVFILLVLLVCTVTGLGIQSYRLEIARRQLEYYRVELSSAQNREQQLTDTIDKCCESTERSNQILSQSANTIQDIRRQLQEIRENYQNMESLLLDSYDSMHNRNNNCSM